MLVLIVASFTLVPASDTLTNLSPPDAEGETIVVRGSILDGDGQPVAAVEVFAYHADTKGRYHDDAYRGTVVTNDRGVYAFETIRPGGYGPAPHIHFRVKAAGHERSATLRLSSAPRPPRTIVLRGVEVTEFSFDIRLGG